MTNRWRHITTALRSDCICAVAETNPDDAKLVCAAQAGGTTALQHACMEGSVTGAAFLIDVARASLEARSNDGATALHWAAGEGHARCVTLLLDRGAAWGAPTRDGSTALHNAAANGLVEVMHALLSWKPPAGAAVAAAAASAVVNVDVAGGSGATALHVAVMRDQLEAARVLLRYGASPHARMKV